MIPKTTNLADVVIRRDGQPSRTYRMDVNAGRILGQCDGLDAMKQAVYKVLCTERFRHLIYTARYGIELADLFGQPAPWVYVEIERRVCEALLADDRIDAVDSFAFDNPKRGTVSVTCLVHSRWGAFPVQTEVKY